MIIAGVLPEDESSDNQLPPDVVLTLAVNATGVEGPVNEMV